MLNFIHLILKFQQAKIQPIRPINNVNNIGKLVRSKGLSLSGKVLTSATILYFYFFSTISLSAAINRRTLNGKIP